MKASAPKNVLVIGTNRSQESKEIARAYGEAHKLPAAQLFMLDCLPGEEIPLSEFRATIQQPVMKHLNSTKQKETIDFLVLTKGVPIRITPGGFSVDSALMSTPLRLPFSRNPEKLHPNPYYGNNKPFSRRKFGFYLATRLDGYLVSHIKQLIENAQKAKRAKGLFLLDVDPRRDKPGYQEINNSMRSAAQVLKQRGFEVLLDQKNDFVGGERNLMGYYSWGSNDAGFSAYAYRSLQFRPGAIAETAVSTSARTFNRASGGQSLIADLIEAGVTGVKGYVSEPFASALCRAHLLFDHYTVGRNLAESFWSATPFIQWKDLVIGDPLCAPFAASDK